MNVNGILLLYHLPLYQDAPTILENVQALKKHSRFPVWNVNTHFGFPKSLSEMRFRVIALHYSLFGNWPFAVGQDFIDYLARSDASYKLAFFQDEYQYCQERFEFLNRYGVDSIYTLVEPEDFDAVYRKHTNARRITHHLTGYVSDDLIGLAHRLTIPDAERSIDVGYRGRPLPYFLGAGAQEKTEIAVEFRKRAAGLGLRLNIETSEAGRIYGEDWYKFLAQCRACLGVEAGVSVFDLEGKVRRQAEAVLAENPSISFAELSASVLRPWENNVFYRTISPRHFEAAAFRVCQILFEGKYSGIMKPMVHYIPLRKDFSNFDDCIRMFRDEALRRELTNNAHRDLIASGNYSYQKFIEVIDEELLAAGLTSELAPDTARKVSNRLDREQKYLEFRTRKNALLYHKAFPGRRALALIGGPPLRMLRKLRRAISGEPI